jgi:hypothetical protein
MRSMGGSFGACAARGSRLPKRTPGQSCPKAMFRGCGGEGWPREVARAIANGDIGVHRRQVFAEIPVDEGARARVDDGFTITRGSF